MAWFQPQVPDDHGGHACAARLNLKDKTPGAGATRGYFSTTVSPRSGIFPSTSLQ
jgi:hypothetical protein